MVVGRWLLVEGVTPALDSCLVEAITAHASRVRSAGGGGDGVAVGTTAARPHPSGVEMHPEFQMFLVTRSWSPHFSPAVRCGRQL
jgi:hypothetical protein